MKKVYFFLFLLAAVKSFGATKFWKGTAGDGLWTTATNWVGDAVPLSADDVVLDNSALAVTYTVILPTTALTVNSLSITPSGLNNITVILPVTNTNSPGFQTTGSIFINSGGLLKNSSGGANPTMTVGATTADSMYIYNGGAYEHNAGSGVTPILDKVSTAPGTEYGLFHYNLALSGIITIAMQGRTFGSVEFSAGNFPSALTYTSTGTANALPVKFRGNFKVNAGANFSNLGIGGLSFAGNFTNNGNFNYAPVFNANPGTRSLFFNGTGNTQVISGTGNFTLGGTVLVNMEVSSGAVVSLQRSITAFSTGDSIIVQPNATLLLPNENNVSGTGSIFFNDTLSTLKMGSANGITSAGATGNVQNDIRIFSKKAFYYYNGTVAQASGSGLPDSVYKLYIQNPADVTLSSPVSITQTLALDSGRLLTATAATPKLNLGAIITSIGSNSYGETNLGNINSFVSGPMSIETSSTSIIAFPIGRLTGPVPQYAPVKLTPFNNTLKTYTADYSDTGHVDKANFLAPPLDHVSLVEYWNIGCSIATSPDGDAKVGLSWRPKSRVGNNNPADSARAVNDLIVSHYYNDGIAGLKWNFDGVAPTFTLSPGITLSYGYITTDIAAGSFSPFTLGTKSVFNILPLKLLSFSGTAGNNAIKLQWITAEEQGVDRYELQKSADGRNFSTISAQPSLNRLSTFAYTATDLQPVAGWNYYRLKVFDNQQHSYYTAAVKVWMGKAGQVMIYPNPAQKELKIILPSRSNSSISIVNSAGQVLKRVSTTEGLLTVNIESLDKGMYLVYIQTNRQAIVQRFVKQ
jgi:Secretion system C-terminal sorting domain